MQTDILSKFRDKVETGLRSIGCDLPIVADTEVVVLRDIFVEFDKSDFYFFRIGDPEKPFATYPQEALDSAATALCMTTLSGIVARAIEAD